MEVENPMSQPGFNCACGVDFGSTDLVAAVALSSNPQKASLVRNSLSHDTTPSVLSLYRKERCVGENALSKLTVCPRNVFSNVTLLLYYNDNIEALTGKYPDISYSVAKSEETQLMFSIPGDDLIENVSLTHVVSMLLRPVQAITRKENENSIQRTVIALPPKMPKSSLSIVKDAAEFAGFKNVDITNTDTAQAYNYGLKLKALGELPAEKAQRILFIDQGSCFTNIYVARYSADSYEILHSVNEQLGSKDADKCLYDYCVQELKEKKRVIIQEYSKPAIRLMEACKKLKEMLSAAPQSCYTASGIMEDEDYTMVMTRAKLEGIIQPYVSAFNALLTQFHAEYTDSIDAIEMIGGGSRIPIIKQSVEKMFNLPLRYTVDSASCIAKGCAIYGVYEDAKMMYPMNGEWRMEITGSNEGTETYKRMIALEEKLHARDDQLRRVAEAKNGIEALLGEMKDIKNRKHGDLVDDASVMELISPLEEWVQDEEENDDPEVFEKKLTELKQAFQQTCKAYHDAVDADRKKVEEELEEERKKKGEEIKDDDIRLPYNTRLSRVESNKKEGNDLFKDKNYVMACQRYQRALSHCRKFYDLNEERKKVVSDYELSLHLNSAQCYIRLEEYKKGIEHCNHAMEIQKENPKALYRRALCYDKLKDVEKCGEDLKVLMKIAPDDPSVKALASKNERDKKIVLQKKRDMAKRMFGGA